MNENLKVSFYLKRERKNEKTGAGDRPVYPIVGKIIIGKSIAQFGTKLKIEERLWHVKSGRAIGKSHLATALNREINKINLNIHRHYSDIVQRTGKAAVVEVKNAFQGIASMQKTLLVLFEEIIRDFRIRVGIDRTISTCLQHEILYKQLSVFLREKYRMEDIPLVELSLSFIGALDYHFRINRKMKPGTVKARMVMLKKVVRIAMHRNLISRSPFEDFQMEKTEARNRSLSSGELDRLMNTVIENPTQRFIRDMFVFSAFTGLSYSDLKKLTWKNIIDEENGNLWISADRQKTKISFHVKLLGIPLQIMERYKGLAPDDKVFPLTSPGRVSIGLKKVAKRCNIEKMLTFHMARYTFATQICLSQGVPIESVSRMLGHCNIRTTQRYARVNNEKIISDMQKLTNKLTNIGTINT